MQAAHWILGLLVAALIACNNKTYEPLGLSKLTGPEIVERATQGIFPDPAALVVKNEKGEAISIDSVQKIPDEAGIAFDQYVDETGTV